MAKSNTRVRDGRLERKDPGTGVWVLHPADPEVTDMMMRVGEDMNREVDEERKRVFAYKSAAQEYVDQAFLEEADGRILVDKVLDFTMRPGFRESGHEIIFIGRQSGSWRREDDKAYSASCWEYSGSMYEPPDGGCDIHSVQEEIDEIKAYLKKWEGKKPDGYEHMRKQRLEYLEKVTKK